MEYKSQWDIDQENKKQPYEGMGRKKKTDTTATEFLTNPNLEQYHAIQDYALQDGENIATNVLDTDRAIGLDTGLHALTTLTGGIKTSALTLVGGATGTGKSILNLNLLVNIAKADTKVCYFDFENGTPETFERLVKIWHGRKEIKDKDNFIEDMVKFKNISYYSTNVLQDRGLSLSKYGLPLLVELIRRRAEEGTQVFSIDPLQALEQEIDSSRKINEQGHITDTLRQLSQELRIAIILCHNFNKSGATNSRVSNYDELKKVDQRVTIPTLSAFKGSSNIVQDAMEVWGVTRFPYVETAKGRGKMMIEILKSRRGGRGRGFVYLDPDTLRITSHWNGDSVVTQEGMDSMFKGV